MARRIQPRLPGESLSQSLALVALLALGAIGLAGPSGLLAWGENNRLLEQRHAEIAQLTAQRDALKNRVNLLDPNHPDPDLVGELLRRDLNVVGADEMVISRR